MKVPLSVGLLTITHAIDTDTAIATATNTDTDTLTATVTVTATAMATAPAPAPAPAPNTSYSCRRFLALSLLVLRLGAFTHYCVYIFFVVVPGQTPKYKPAHTLTTAKTTTPTYTRFDTQSARPSPHLPKIRHISSSELCLPVRGILCFLLLPVA